MRVFLLVLSGSLAFSPVFADEDAYISYSGTALARHSSKILYGEKDVLRYHQERIAERTVLYTCPDGSAFARKTVSYADAIAPDFLLEDTSNGMSQGVRSAGGTRTVFYRDKVQAEKSMALLPVAGLVTDAGFDEFIRANWAALLAGKTLPIQFLIPSRLEVIAFQVQRLRGETVNEIESQVFRLRLSGIRGWVLKGIEVYYSSSQHELVRYDGISDLRDASLDNFETEVNFPPSNRKPATRQAFQAAREAPLAPCR
jgi:hypothetical protein